MEAYFQTLAKTSGASGFLIIRDDASPYGEKTITQRLPSSSSSHSSSSTPSMGPPSLPRRKRSNDDIFSNFKGTARRSQDKKAKARVLKSFFDEVLGAQPVAPNLNANRMDCITDVVKIVSQPSSSKQAARWDADPVAPQNHSRNQSW